jgi:hypothetical protein
VCLQRQSPTVGRVDGIECWEEPDSRTFMVRGVNYMKDRRKVGSDHSIYRRASTSRMHTDQKISSTDTAVTKDQD